jgi:hypothetical protein
MKSYYTVGEDPWMDVNRWTAVPPMNTESTSGPRHTEGYWHGEEFVPGEHYQITSCCTCHGRESVVPDNSGNAWQGIVMISIFCATII